MAGNKKVLVIDDSIIIRLEVRRILETYGVQVLELDNVEDFFRFSGKYRDLNLILLDVSLPGMDGLTALEKMRADRSWAYLPVVMLTARSDRTTVERALQTGAVNYIRKPFTREILLERVEKVLGPLVPPDGDKDVHPMDLDTQLGLEVQRAKRGGTPLSLLEIKVPKEMRHLSRLPEVVALRDKVRQQVREIDSVYITRDRNLVLVLPLTPAQGAQVVMKKIAPCLMVAEDQVMEMVAVTFPDDGAEAKDLLKALQVKGKKG